MGKEEVLIKTIETGKRKSACRMLIERVFLYVHVCVAVK